MLYSSLISVFLAVASFSDAAALNFRKRDILYRRQGNETAGGAGGASNMTGGGGASNMTGGGASNMTGGGSQVPVVTIGGSGLSSNASAQGQVNATGVLSVTQLYQVSEQIESSLKANHGCVIVGKKKSFESMAFFSAIVFNSTAPIVLCEDAAIGTVVASDPGAAGRGPLIIFKNTIYSGTLPAYNVPVGVVNDDHSCFWFYDAAMPQLTQWNSTLRTNFTNFTSTSSQAQVNVPIVFEEGISPTLLQSVGSFIQGLVVIGSGQNSTDMSSSGAPSIPVVYAQESRLVNAVNNSTMPSNAISAGYLTPIQAQIMLSVAVVNGVNSTESLKSLFPSPA
ncbi:Sps100p KNAG_0H03750 [Huiozyma naganishii CBS 8797]|uniref:Uncharacterized protein n=1 Tax=Huiozyma naganishii (strain ATCC MYA-139 / BCRC 22969 / CBS 8797 / KCTC 17520 / NBRC 10181 / NCYC 3082 / Yp74L-3) TaxID=1071383 RepID=J7S8X2_HUIN7|nr:hypothetical protein KNAG_0H03750 [Kazachstania naganishii CBS 8797]CCK71789.1 hypothetical protein KNAG_0H03750 [Kazachstania naganishii CBS 8797]